MSSARPHITVILRAALALFASTACNPFPSFDEFVGDAGRADATSPTGDAAGDGGSCPSGTTVSPVRAFDASPTGVTATATCNLDNALVRDDQFAGLDTHDDKYGKIDDKAVKGCLGVELPGAAAKVIVRARSDGNACGASACANTDAGCGSGHKMAVFGGSSRTDLHKLGDDEDIGPSASDHEFGLPLGVEPVRIVVVCRTTFGADRDDVVVDWIGGRCP